VRYEWNIEKAEANLRKHGVAFVDAIAALEDPSRLEEVEPAVVAGEERVDVIGIAHGAVLFVVTTLRDEDHLGPKGDPT